ncbi:hypothetical protein SDC9_193194 [bioreactor metagenome]|uniref:Uncharacterized protein n=1 Tax=bioreactor metagenome TaxID=1076179 RepID=A0A645I428_9ZZZZ
MTEAKTVLSSSENNNTKADGNNISQSIAINNSSLCVKYMGKCLSEHIKKIDGFFDAAITAPKIHSADNECFLIRSHMHMFMKKISTRSDLLYLSSRNRVITVHENFVPKKLPSPMRDCHAVLSLPVGFVTANKIKMGEYIELS